MTRKKKFNTKYSREFNMSVIMDMRENGLGYGEVVRKYWGVDTYKESDNHRSQVRLFHLNKSELLADERNVAMTI